MPEPFLSHSSAGYKILCELGRGGYGVVYSVEDPMNKRSVALKILLKNKASEAMHKRFLQEIKIASNLQHPNIMPVYESGYLDDGSLYYTMKELSIHKYGGRKLKDILEQKKHPPLSERLEIFLKICEGLEYAHSRGILHRDLKPDNIGVGRYGEVLILDWGIAKQMRASEIRSEIYTEEDFNGQDNLLKGGDENLTRAGSMMGSPGYMSPEQAKGKKDLNSSSDVFSMGAILYELLCLKPAFEGSAHKKITDTLLKDPMPPHKAAPHLEIPIELSLIAMKALMKDEKKRYAGIHAMREDILRYQYGYSVSAKKDNVIESIKKWILRNKTLSATIMGVLLSILITALILHWIHNKETTDKILHYVSQAEKILKSKSLTSAENLEKEYPFFYQRSEEHPVAKKRREESIREYMKARVLLEKALELSLKDPQILRSLYEVEKEIGMLALLGRNYLLSKASFQRCAHLMGREREKKLLEKVEEKEKEIQRYQTSRIEAIMKELSQSPPEEGMMEEYITEIVRMKGAHTVRKMISYLFADKFWQRKIAIESLGKLGNNFTKENGKDAVEILIERLKSLDIKKNLEEAECLVWALGRLRDERANEAVVYARLDLGQDSIFWEKTKVPFRWIPMKKSEPQKSSRLSAEEYYRKGFFYREKREYEKAIEAFNQAIQLNPQHIGAYAARGIAYEEKKEYNKAIEDFDQAIRLNPQYAEAYNNRGMAYFVKREYDRAIEDFNQAIQFNPQYATAYDNRGMAYCQKGEYDKAIEDHTQAIKLKPQSTIAYNNRGIAYCQKREYEKAIEDFNQVIKLNPNFTEAYASRGNIYNARREYEKAIENFTQALSLNPQYAVAYASRGNTYLRKKEYEKAIEDCTQALSLNPQYATAYNVRGNTYLKKKEYEKALEDYNQVIKFYPQYAEVYSNRGLVYHAKGIYHLAAKDFKKYLELNPRAPDAKQLQAYIQRHLKDE